MTSRRRYRIALIVLLLFLAFGGSVGFWLLRTYSPNQTTWFPKCLFYQLTGLHCPGCGTTRSLRAVVQGDLWLAIRCNALFIIGLPTLLIAAAWQTIRERRGDRVGSRIGWVCAVVIVLFFIIRNVPSPSASWFAPPNLP